MTVPKPARPQGKSKVPGWNRSKRFARPSLPTVPGAGAAEPVPIAVTGAGKPAASGNQTQDAGTTAFRPTRRPPMATLCILDDGRDDGEWVRIRGDKLVIGRTEGDVCIPHDTMISSRHAEITRQAVQGSYRWFLTDLQSTNGTYVRVAAALLRHGQELLIGSKRFRFDAAEQGAEVVQEDVADEGDPQATRGWQSIAAADLVPSLVELRPHGEAKRIFLTQPDNWIGRDPAQCSVVLADDPLVSPRHARIHRDTKGRWHCDNANSLNGIWMRIDRAPLEGTAQFQLGEQRFLLRIVAAP